MSLDWDDLRYALAVAEGGSLVAGAKRLGVNHTTAMRRIATFERRLGARLFERLPSGYVLTPHGEELLNAAQGIREAVSRLELKLAGSDLSPSGPVRITTTDTLMTTLLAGILADLKSMHPGLEIEVATSNPFVSLTRREADVAIRPAEDPPIDLFGRRISSIGFAIFGKSDTGTAPGETIEALSRRPWIVPDDSLRATAAARWIARELPGVEIAARAGSFVTIAALAETGMGVAALPCYLGDGSSRLIRLTPPIDAMRTGLWVLTHEHLQRTARIRTVMDFVGMALARQRRVIEGA